MSNDLIDIDLNKEIENPQDFFGSVSKDKLQRRCKRAFFFSYILKLERKKVEIADIGTMCHDSFADIYKNGINDTWYDMTPQDLANHFYWVHRGYIEKHKLFISWNKILDNNIRNLASFEAGRFHQFKSTVPREVMNDYFCPVLAEEFLKNGIYQYNYIPDAIFRLFEKGHPKKDKSFIIFDLKAGSAQPEKVRSDDKSQVTQYSILWNQIMLEKRKVKENEEFWERKYNKAKQLAEETPTKENKNRATKLKKLWNDIVDSNKKIVKVGGVINHWAVLYLGNGLLTHDIIKPRGITYAKKRIDEFKKFIYSPEWIPAWNDNGPGYVCESEYFDKLLEENIEIKCDYYDICFRLQHKDLFDEFEW